MRILQMQPKFGNVFIFIFLKPGVLLRVLLILFTLAAAGDLGLGEFNDLAGIEAAVAGQDKADNTN